MDGLGSLAARARGSHASRDRAEPRDGRQGRLALWTPRSTCRRRYSRLGCRKPWSRQPRHQLRLEPSTWLAQDRLSGNQLPDSLSCASLALRAVRRSTSNCRLGVGMRSAWVCASCSSELPCWCAARADGRSKKASDILEKPCMHAVVTQVWARRRTLSLLLTLSVVCAGPYRVSFRVR